MKLLSLLSAAACVASCAAVRRADLPPPILLSDLQTSRAGSGTRIVGGTQVTSGREFMAQLLASRINEYGTVIPAQDGNFYVYKICGGSVISSDAVLTAAHCVELDYDETDPSDIRLRIDFVLLDTLGSSLALGTVVDVLSREVHPSYSAELSRNDIAVLKLNESQIISTTPIDLLFESVSYGAAANVNTAVVVSGWGATSEGGSVSSQLREVSMPVLSNSVCNSYYSPFYVQTVMLCAGVLQGGRDSCQGDSGGPLFAEPINGTRPVQIGVVSFGDGCAKKNVAGVYTRVSAFESFIRSHTTLATPPVGNGDVGFPTYVYVPPSPAHRGVAATMLAVVLAVVSVVLA